MGFIATEAILLVAGLTLALAGAARPLRAQALAWVAALVCAAATLAALVGGMFVAVDDAWWPRWLTSALSLDALAAFFAVFAPLAGLFVCLSAGEYLERQRIAHAGEFFGLLLLSLFSVCLLAASADLITFYLAIEFLGITAYALAGFAKRDPRSSEAGIKYFLVGAVASAIMLYGMSLLYGASGATSLAAIGAELRAHPHNPVAFGGVALVLVGLGFKVALAPFHMWCPDAYEGAPTPITAFLSVAPKAAGFAGLLRFLFVAAPAVPWAPVLATLAGLTMIVGNLLAIPQSNIKRMLAYSSIGQAGYILIGLVSAPLSPLGLPAVLFYLMAYLLMNLGAFAVVIATSNAIGSDAIDDYAGLARRSPLLGGALVVYFLSLAGIPPLAGFLGKLLLFASAVEAEYYSLAVIGVVNSVISIYYYFNVVRLMFMAPPTTGEPLRVERALLLVVVATLVGTFALGLFPHAVLRAAGEAAAVLPMALAR